MRRAGIIASAALLVAACSLFTDLGGFDDDPAASADGATDAFSDPAVTEDAPSDAAGTEDTFVVPDAALDACPIAVPLDGLVAFYPLDEGQGSTVTDCSPSKLHGALVGAPASLKWVPGRNAGSGTAVDLDGNGACFYMGDAPILEFAGKSFTVSAWIKVRAFQDPANVARQVFARENASGSLRGWHLGTDDPSSIELDIVVPDGGQREIATPMPPNVWTHVAATFDGSMKIYVNGVLANTNAGPWDLGVATNGAARLGCKALGSRVFDGAIDDVRVYRRVLTTTEIATLAQP